MAECSKCGKQSMSFTCRYCGKKFCSEHRLPEKHNCEGLETGKKEEYQTSTEKEKSQKWFDEKFSQKKQGTPKREKEFQKPGFLNETKRILKSNIAFLIIGITGLAFMLHQAFPAMKQFLTLSPALTEAAVQATNAAAQEIQPNIGNILSKTVVEAPWTIVTVMLVHANLFHFLANMITFYFFGTAVEKAVGGVKMLKMYLISGIIASLAYILFRNIIYQLYGPINGVISLSPAVGASGAVVAMVGLVAMLYPEAEVLLYFIIPMKIRTAVYFFGGLETFNLLAKLLGINLPAIGGFASSAHLAGLVIGLYYGKKLQDKYGRKSSVFNPVGY